MTLDAILRRFLKARDQDMGGRKLMAVGAPTQAGDAVRWDELQVGLNYIIGVEWDTSSSSPALTQIDAYGTAITQKSHAWFDSHPIYGNMWRCLLSVAGVPTFGQNARGTGLTLDGSAGQVMVRIPKCYVKSEKVDTKIRWWISPVAFTGFEIHPAFLQRGGIERAQLYLGAYAACLGIVPVTGVKYLVSKSGEQPLTGGEIIEVSFDSGSVAPVVGEIITGEPSLMKGAVVASYVATGSYAGGDAAGKVYVKAVSRRLNFNTGGHEPVVGEVITGATSGATGICSKVVVTSGSWGTSDALGYILLEGGSGNGYAYTVAENIRDPSSNVVAKPTDDGSTLGQFTVGGNFDGSVGGANLMTCQSVGSALAFTRQNAETYANNIGSSRWGCENIWSLDLVTMLYLIEYGNWNSQSVSVGIGQGVVNKSAGRRFNGEMNGALSANSNIAVNGTGTGTGTDGLTPIVYRGIENLWGNVYQFVIGLDALDAAYRILNRNGTGVPACPLTAGNYESSVAAPIAYNVSTMPDGYAKDLLYEDLTKYLCIANLGAGSSGTYLCDMIYWHRPGQVNVWLVGSFWSVGALTGVGYRSAIFVASLSARGVGARPEFV
jgi:hypothetical protein